MGTVDAIVTYQFFFLLSLGGTPEEGPAAEAGQPPIVPDVFLFRLGGLAANVAVCKVIFVVRVGGRRTVGLVLANLLNCLRFLFTEIFFVEQSHF